MKNSLFGHLASRFSESHENLATEALCYILNRSEIANKAFVHFVSQVDNSLPPSLKFETQFQKSISAGVQLVDNNISGNVRPDIVGKDVTGKKVLIGEIKFWAGLTEHQPVDYLKEFHDSSLLIFIAPSKRLPLLTNELLRLCQDKDAKLESQPIKNDLDKELKIIAIDKYPVLAVTSWRKVLNSMLHAVEAEGDTDTLSDIKQLQGLCDRMDEESFLPLQSEELTASIGKRIVQFCGLVDKVTDGLVKEGIANISGLKATATNEYYRRYMRIHGHGCAFQVHYKLWSSMRETPLWFSFQKTGDGKWIFAKEAKEKLLSFELEEPKRLFQINDELYVPIFVLPNREEDEVIRSLRDQLQEVISKLATIDE